jgi:hypothetical protein
MIRCGVGQYTSCSAPPTHSGYVRAKGKGLIRVFPCDQHAGQVDAAAPMTDEDRAELDGRIAQFQRALAGLPYERVGPVCPGRTARPTSSPGR